MRSYGRREFLKLAAGAAGAAAISGRLRAADERPNIIFIMTDDHAAHAIGCYGGKMLKTPNFDRLAREGMLFTNAFVTNALCAPSRAVLLTGKYSHLNGLKDNSTDFDGSQQTFPKLLQRAGYYTALVGKWHLRTDPTGFDYWNILPGQGIYRDPDMIEMGVKSKKTGYATQVITDVALETLDKRPKDKPFCLLLHHKAPHRPWDPATEHAGDLSDADLPYPATFDDDKSEYKTRSDAAREADMRVANMPDYEKEAPKDLSPEDRKKWNFQRYLKDYLRTTASVDDSVGEVLDYLKKTGLEKNTLVIYTSDNGFFLGDHGWYDKRFMFEESLRVPLIMRLPGKIRPGTRDSHFVLNTDYSATFLDYAGVKVPDDMQGTSLRPLLEGRKPAKWRNSVYYHYYEYPLSHKVREHYGVRTNRYKLIHYYTIGQWEMFDLQKDPHELTNVYADPAYKAKRSELETELKRLRKELKVPEKE